MPVGVEYFVVSLCVSLEALLPRQRSVARLSLVCSLARCTPCNPHVGRRDLTLTPKWQVGNSLGAQRHPSDHRSVTLQSWDDKQKILKALSRLLTTTYRVLAAVLICRLITAEVDRAIARVTLGILVKRKIVKSFISLLNGNVLVQL